MWIILYSIPLGLNLFLQSIANAHLGTIQFFTVINSAAMIILVCIIW